MKMFANMSKRDRNLLVVLLVVVVFYLCYSLVITPALGVSEMLQSELDGLKSELERAEDLMGKADALEGQAGEKRAELSKKYSVFFGGLNQAQLLYKTDTLMLGAGIPVQSYTPLESTGQVPLEKGVYEERVYPLLERARELAPDLHEETPSNQDPGGAEADTTDSIPASDITFGFRGASYESIYGFIRAIEQMNKAVILKSLDVEKREEGLDGQLVFAFYGIPALEEKHQGELRFNPAIPKGKVNLFQ